MRYQLRFTFLGMVLGAVLLLAACGPAPTTESVSPISSPTAPAPTVAVPAPTEAVPAATPEPALDPQVQALVDEAKLDLSKRAGVAPDDIVLQSVEARMWGDSSLGCPQPGMQYLQVVTPGYLIRLAVGGQVYQYHTDQRNVVYCENPEAGDEGVVDAAAQLIAAARADLVSVAGVADSDIEVIESQLVQWRDSSLGCPKAGQMYTQVITPGYLIRLRAGGQEYAYHTSMTQVMLCRE